MLVFKGLKRNEYKISGIILWHDSRKNLHIRYQRLHEDFHFAKFSDQVPRKKFINSSSAKCFKQKSGTPEKNTCLLLRFKNLTEIS